MNKLSDNEIKKALEDMIKFADMVGKNVLDMVDVQKLKSILDLINRYEAEKEKLKKELALSDECVDKFDNLFAKYKEKSEDLEKRLKTAKAEAYKEFAERLKFIMFPSVKLEYKDIDELLKEMESESK